MNSHPLLGSQRGRVAAAWTPVARSTIWIVDGIGGQDLAAGTFSRFNDEAFDGNEQAFSMSTPAAATAAPSAPPAAGTGSKMLAKNPRLPFAPRVNGKRFVVQRSVSKFKTNFSKVPERYTLKFVKLLAEELNARLARIEAGPGLQRILKKLVQNKCLTNITPHRPVAPAQLPAIPSVVGVSVDPHGQTPVAPATKPAAPAVRK